VRRRIEEHDNELKKEEKALILFFNQFKNISSSSC
jgi:hypothetical protein